MIPEPPSDQEYPSALRWSGRTDRGRVRANNEDAFLALTYDANEVRYLGKVGEAPLDHGDFVFAVSDGMGGAKSGEFASKIAVEKITKLLPKSYRLAANQLGTGMGDVLIELFHAVHAELIRLGSSYDECSGMGATLSLACFTPGWVHFAHIGDSRLYYLPKGGKLFQISHDHSYVGWLRRQGKLNEREARIHPRKNVLSQALGAGHQIIDPHVGAVRCETGDTFLLCSDGVIDGLWDSGLEERLLSKTQNSSIASLIVDAAVLASGRDNATAVVVECL